MAVQEADPRLLQVALNRFDARWRLTRCVAWLPRGIAIGLTLGLALAVAARLQPLLPPDLLLSVAVNLAGAGVIVGWLVIWLWRRSPMQRARRFDQALKLKERLSTALEIERGVLRVDDPAIAAAQRADAIAIASSTKAAAFLELRTDWRDWTLAAIVGGLLAVSLILPNPQDAVLAEQEAVEQAITEQLVALEELREEVLEDPTLTTAERAEIVRTLDDAIETLSQSSVSQEEAVAALDQAEQELRDLSETFAEDRQEALSGLSGQFSDAGLTDVAQALEEGNFSEAGESLSEALDGMSPEEQAALAEQLESMADQLADSNPELSEALSEAADALQNGDTAAAQAALDAAADAMGETGDSSNASAADAADKTQKSGTAVAQAGGDEASQPGEGGMGQAQAAQPGQGGEGEGQASGGHTAGHGEDEGAEQGGLAGTDVGTNEPGDGGETPYDDIYAPQRIGGEGGEQVDIPGDPDSGIPNRQGEFVDNPTGNSSVDYSAVYADYEGSVNEALDSGYIPLGMRDLIQSYFSRLDPGESN